MGSILDNYPHTGLSKKTLPHTRYYIILDFLSLQNIYGHPTYVGREKEGNSLDGSGCHPQ